MIKKFGIYLLGEFGTKILSFLMVPLYTSLLLPNEFGLYDYWGTIIGLISAIVGLEFFRTVYTKLLEYKHDVKLTKKYISVAVQFLGVQILVAILVCCILYFIIPEYAVFISLIIGLSMVGSFFSSLARGIEKNSIMATSGIIQTFFTLSATIILLYTTNFQDNVAVLFIGQITGMSVSNIYYFVILNFRLQLFNNLSLKLYTKKTYYQILRFSLPLIPSTISWWVMNVSDRFIIVNYLGDASNGIYAMAYKFPSLLMMINNIIAMVWQDEAILTHKNDDKQKYYTKQLQRFVILQFSALIIFIIGFKIFAPLFLYGDFIQAMNIVPILALSVVFSGVASFYGSFYLSTGRTSGAFSTSVYGAIVNIVFNFTLVQVIGLYAAAISTVLSFMVMAFIRVFEFKKELGIQFPWIATTTGMIAFIGLYFLIY